jgi:hypothetical protein
MFSVQNKSKNKYHLGDIVVPAKQTVEISDEDFNQYRRVLELDKNLVVNYKNLSKAVFKKSEAKGKKKKAEEKASEDK